MTIAKRICQYMEDNETATRPQMCLALHEQEKSIETAVRKLLREGCLVDTGDRVPNSHGRASPVYERGSKEFDEAASKKGPKSAREPKHVAYSFSDLGNAMAGFFSVREEA
jgi:hypothetical protein